MNTPVLSICIPTYNRLAYLQELLSGLLPQITSVEEGRVELLVSNNVSSDGTEAYCATLSHPCFRFWTNERNIGGDRNFLKCIQEAHGDYVWLVGDDDLIPEGSIRRILQIISSQKPSLIISSDVAEEVVYPSYEAFLCARCQRDSGPAIAHTLISANVFRREIFDMTFATQMLYTQYAHMFGLVRNIRGIIVSCPDLIRTRPVRAAFASFPSNLCVKQALYLRYLAKRFNQPRFRRFALRCALNLPFEYASRLKGWMVRKGILK